MVAARKISATDGTLKQHIAHDGKPASRMKKHHVARRMPRAVQHLQLLLSETDGIAVLKPAIRLKGIEACESEAPPLLGQLLDPESISLLWSLKRYAVPVGINRRLTTMIDVAVGKKDLFQLGPRTRQRLVNLIKVTARIDRRGPTAMLTDQQRTVLHERRNRHDKQLHDGLAASGRVWQAGISVIRQIWPRRIHRAPGMPTQQLKRHDSQGMVMCGLQNHRRRHARFTRLEPATGAQTPAIARLEAGKSPLRTRRHEIVTAYAGKLKKRLSYASAHGVAAQIIGARLAAPGSHEPGERVK